MPPLSFPQFCPNEVSFLAVFASSVIPLHPPNSLFLILSYKMHCIFKFACLFIITSFCSVSHLWAIKIWIFFAIFVHSAKIIGYLLWDRLCTRHWGNSNKKKIDPKISQSPLSFHSLNIAITFLIIILVLFHILCNHISHILMFTINID